MSAQPDHHPFLTQDESLFRSLFDLMPQLGWTARPDGFIDFYNRGWYEYTGTTFEEMQGWGWEKVHDPEVLPRVVERWQHSLKTGTPFEMEFPLRRHDGEFRTFLTRVNPVRDAKGKLIRWVGINTDIEEQKRMEVYFRGLFDSMPQLGWTARADGFIDFYNRGWYEYTGKTPEEMQGWGWESVHDPAVLPKVVERWKQSLSTGMPFEMEFPLRRHDGEFRTFLTRVNPVRDAAGKVVRWVGINTDVEEQRRQAATLSTLNSLGRTLAARKDLKEIVQAVTDAATQLSGAQFGAFFYNVLNENGEAYMLYTIAGVPREQFERFPMPRNTAIFEPTFSGRGTVLLDDVRKDARYGKNAPYRGLPSGHLPVVSYLAVPVVSRTGEVFGGLFFGHERAGVFTEESARLVEGLASQAAVAIENARLYERLVAERALIRKNEERYRTLVEASPVPQAVGTSDAQGYVVEDSPSWRALTGQTFEEMKGRGWLQAVDPHHRAGLERALDEAIAARTIFQYEFRLRMQDGTIRWFTSKSVPVFNDDGSVREWVGTTSDIDQRKSTEEHLRFLARANELFVSSLDYETTLINLARAAVPALADWAAVDITVGAGDRPYRRLAVAHVDPAKVELAWELDRRYKPDADHDPITQAIASGKPQLVREVHEGVLRSLSHDEEHFRIVKELGLCSWMIVPLMGRRAPLGAVTFVSSDSRRLFTELDLAHAADFARRASAAIENAMLYREAQEANRAKDDFLATLSHELRTPMTAILGWSRMLHDEQMDAETSQTAIETILRSAQAQAQLIDDVLDMSRIIAGKMQIRQEAVDLAGVVREAIRTVQPAASSRSIPVQFEVQPGASTLITGDAGRLQQIIWNLLTNAIKFTPRDGRIEVKLEQAGSFVRLAIHDTGRGIASDFLPHVFEPFRQAEHVTTRTQGGLGLGLAIVKYLVEAHGGNISAASEGEGKGATFVVELPVRALARQSLRRAEPANAQRVAKQGELPSLEGVKVLFVDDQPDARALVRAVLERCGAEVAVAASAAEALDQLQGASFHVLVSDIAMPGDDGFALIRRVRSMDGYVALPALAMTAFGRAQDQDRILRAGFDAYLLKPVEPVTLALQIKSLVS